MIRCADCGKEISEDEAAYCDMYRAPLYEECENLRLCFTCAELWEAIIDIEAEEEF